MFNRRKKKENEKFFLIFEKATKEKLQKLKSLFGEAKKGKELIEGTKKNQLAQKMT